MGLVPTEFLQRSSEKAAVQSSHVDDVQKRRLDQSNDARGNAEKAICRRENIVRCSTDERVPTGEEIEVDENRVALPIGQVELLVDVVNEQELAGRGGRGHLQQVDHEDGHDHG